MIYFITGNQHKLREVQAILGADVVTGLELDLPEIQELDPQKIIEAKLQAAFEHHAGPFIVEDVSFYLNELHELPGPLIKWFLQSLGANGIADLAIRLDSQKASIRALLGYAIDKDHIHYFEGSVDGQVVLSRGRTDFGFDPIFEPDNSDKTFGEMTDNEKNAISHRRQALEKLKVYLDQSGDNHAK